MEVDAVSDTTVSINPNPNQIRVISQRLHIKDEETETHGMT